MGPGLVLAMSVVVYQVTVNGQTMAETLADNLGPVLIAGALGVLLWLPVAFVWGLKQQRDEAWSKLDVLTSRLAGPPFVELTPVMSEKVGPGRYTWLTKARERHEMKVCALSDHIGKGMWGRFIVVDK